MGRFPCHVSDEGLLVPKHREVTHRWRGKEVWVEIHRNPMVQRSGQANKYLWKLYGNIAAETGNDPETIHQALKREAVRVGILEPQYVLMGSQLLEGEPTTITHQEAFGRYVEWIKQGCIHGDLVGMRVPLPGEE